MIDEISGGLTVFTILMGIAVVVHWRKAAVEAVKQKEPLESYQWLIIGVVIAFIGQGLDNLYWLLTWTSNYISSDGGFTRWLFDHGTLANIPFRQTCGIVAAYCHIHAAVMMDRAKNSRFKLFMMGSCLAGVLFSLGMVFFKY